MSDYEIINSDTLKIIKLTPEVINSLSKYNKIVLNNNFNELLSKLPDTVTHLTLNLTYNQPLPKLPSTLTHLILGFNYNQPLPKLPSTLTHLILGYCFNQPIPELPPSLTHLILGVYFNQNQLFDYLPQGLLYLEIGTYSNPSLVNLPNTLQTLIMSASHSETLDMLPDSIETLEIGICVSKFNKLPANLKSISISSKYKYKDDLLLLKSNLKINLLDDC